MQTQQTIEPKLDKPGAGLPFLEWFIAKYVLLPQRFKALDTRAALAEFTSETEQIVASVKALNPKDLTERRLIPRLRGLEDSSRYWSVAMTLQHLVIVGNLFRQAIVALSNGIVPPGTASTATVKPTTDVEAATILDEFEKMSQKFAETVKRTDFEKNLDTKFAHPWFGPLTAKQWVVIAATHQQIHRVQISKIIKLL